jgi:hypothetical protein
LLGLSSSNGAQLKRYGTNIAKWGFNVCALHNFNDLRHGKNGKKSAFNNFRVTSFTTSLPPAAEARCELVVTGGRKPTH